MASLHVPSLKAKDFSTPSLPLIDGHHSLERMAVDWIALFTIVLSDHMCRRNSHEAFERRPFAACGLCYPPIFSQMCWVDGCRYEGESRH